MTKRKGTSILLSVFTAGFLVALGLSAWAYERGFIYLDQLFASVNTLASIFAPHVGILLGVLFCKSIGVQEKGVFLLPFIMAIAWNLLVVAPFAWMNLTTKEYDLTGLLHLCDVAGGYISFLVAGTIGYFACAE